MASETKTKTSVTIRAGAKYKNNLDSQAIDVLKQLCRLVYKKSIFDCIGEKQNKPKCEGVFKLNIYFPFHSGVIAQGNKDRDVTEMINNIAQHIRSSTSTLVVLHDTDAW